MARPLCRWERHLLIVGVLVLVLVLALLLIHFALMPHHEEGGPCSSCAVQLIAELSLLFMLVGRPASRPLVGPVTAIPIQPVAAIVSRRSPVTRGVVLRL